MARAAALTRPGPSRCPRLRAAWPVVLRGNHFVGGVVAVLLRVEPAPAVLPQLRSLRAEDAVGIRVAVRDDRSGDLVVALVLAEAGRAGRRRVAGVDRRRRIPALCEPAQRSVCWVPVVEPDVEDEAGVERVALLVQRVAGVLDERDLVLGDERRVVETGVRDVALVEEAERAGVGRRILLRQLEYARPAAVRVLRAGHVPVARLVEEEIIEPALRPDGGV